MDLWIFSARNNWVRACKCLFGILFTWKSNNSNFPPCHTDDDIGKHNESDVQILEPQISILNLDEYEETNVSSPAADNSELLAPVKIKQEPKYEGYEDDEDDGFEEVGTFEADPVDILEEASGE